MLNSDRISDTAHGDRSSIKRTKTFLFSLAMAACFDIRYVCTVSAKAFESRPSTKQHFYAKLVGATDKNWQNSKNSWQSATGPLFYPSAVNFKLSFGHFFLLPCKTNARTFVSTIIYMRIFCYCASANVMPRTKFVNMPILFITGINCKLHTA